MNKIERIVKSTEGEVRELLDRLVHTCAELSQQNTLLSEHNEKIAQCYRALCKQHFGSTSEQLKSYDIPKQLLCDVFNEFELVSLEIEMVDDPVVEMKIDGAQKKKTAGRKPLPRTLPRIIVEHDLPSEDKTCDCGNEMQCIGSEISEQLNYIPATLEVIEHHTKKYCCSSCAEKNKKNPEIKVPFKTAIKPEQIIPKSMATPSLLAHIVTEKFCDHMPLYRLEASFKRLGIALSRQTMSDWVLKLGKAVVPLVNLMQEKILEYRIAFADETPLQVLNEPGRAATAKSYMWLFIGGPLHQRILIYQYHATRGSEIPELFFSDYQGALHCDGYTAYTRLFTKQGLTGVNCWAHVRRKFLDSVPKGKSIKGVAAHVLAYITALYAIEKALRDNNADATKIKETRLEKEKPILEKLKIYLDEKQPKVPPKSVLGNAIAYTLKRWLYLTTYLEDGSLEIDNNRAERGIKPFVMGRKAWLFANSVAGAHASCRLFSLVETAKANGLNPNTYLEYIFKELPACKSIEDYEKLLPWAITDADISIAD